MTTLDYDIKKCFVCKAENEYTFIYRQHQSLRGAGSGHPSAGNGRQINH